MTKQTLRREVRESLSLFAMTAAAAAGCLLFGWLAGYLLG
jgi:hypothetical protein